jgi:Flp pilus assembly protein TadD
MSEITRNAEQIQVEPLREANQAQREGRHGDAVRHFRKAEIARPEMPVCAFGQGVAALSGGRFAEALAALTRVRIFLPGSAGVHHNLGVCLRRLGQSTKSAVALRSAATLSPDSVGAIRSLAQIAADNGDASMVQREARKAIIVDPSTASLVNAAELAMAVKDTKSAARFVDNALGRSPDDISALRVRAGLDAALGNLDRAIEVYRTVVDQEPLDRLAWSNLGVVLSRAGRWDKAAETYRRYNRLTRGRPVNEKADDPFPSLPTEPIVVPTRKTSWHRIAHDHAQLRRLLAAGLLPSDYEREADAYGRLLDSLDGERRQAISFELSEEELASIRRVHDRMTYRARTAPMGDHVLNGDLDWPAIEGGYLAATPRAAVIDGLLTPSSLSELRRFCLDSTIWFALKGAGYLGAYFREGFNDPLLVRIATELRERMPRVLGPHPLRMIWAYSYEQTMVGINPHADFAAVNVNFWITPDEANLDPETGGLLVYDKPAPEDWGFEEYNGAPASEVFEFLGDSVNRPMRVAHRCNRALLFDSRLFHETDRMSFSPGFENRRINITMLFGDGG